jgi:oxygen-dependent protoporphyrinogen oxidase
MQSLIDTLVEQLSGVKMRTGTHIPRLQQSSDHRWTLTHGDDTIDDFDAVILATSAIAAAHLLNHVQPELAELVKGIEHASTAVVCLGYRRDQVAHPLDAFGSVIPSIEGRRILAVSFSNRKFPNRAPDGHVLLRVFVGGASRGELAQLPDDELTNLVRDELADLLGVQGDASVQQIVRWPLATPQYHLGHLPRLLQIERHVQRLTNLTLAGNAYSGIGIPQCIHSGWQAADAIMAH